MELRLGPRALATTPWRSGCDVRGAGQRAAGLPTVDHPPPTMQAWWALLRGQRTGGSRLPRKSPTCFAPWTARPIGKPSAALRTKPASRRLGPASGATRYPGYSGAKLRNARSMR
eukprot:8287640-Pyramimonas_sp.AAC.1